MATPPDFSSGAVLTAAQLDQIGLWRISTTSVGTAVSSVTVSNCFSADFDNYQIVYSGMTASGSTTFQLKLGSTTTGYYYNLLYSIFGGAANNGLVASNQAAFIYSGVVAPNGAGGTIDVYNPYKAMRTGVRGTYLEFLTTGAIGNFAGFLDNATSYTGFTLTPAGQTVTGGTVTVYGYNNLT